jgi:hypothetical protein
MNTGNFFSGVSALFWSLTFALVGLIALGISVGEYETSRVILVAAGAYAVIGVAYGCWVAC